MLISEANAEQSRIRRDGMAVSRRPAALMVEVRFVPSLRDSPQTFSLPGTHVPGYRLFRPRSTSSGQALRDCFVASVESPSNLATGCGKIRDRAGEAAAK